MDDNKGFLKKLNQVLVLGSVVLVVTVLAVKIGFYDTQKVSNSEKLSVSELSLEEAVVVIDAGHGGKDPGKIGVNGNIEQQINLSIAKKLQKLLETAGCTVVMTRIDEGCCSQAPIDATKNQDLIARCKMIEDVQPDCMISIHQNSYTSQEIKGAQVFYYRTSTKGATLAAMIQQKLIELVDPDNTRVQKENENYYILKNTSVPAVIVECGFLSNPQEEAYLIDDTYQTDIANAIAAALGDYFSQEE